MAVDIIKRRASKRRWEQRNPEKVNALRRKLYWKNPQKYRKAAQRYAAKNKNIVRKRTAEWWAAHPEKHKEYYEKHKERRKEQARQAYWKDPEKRRAYSRRYRELNKEKVVAAYKLWKEQNPTKAKASASATHYKNYRKHRTKRIAKACIWRKNNRARSNASQRKQRTIEHQITSLLNRIDKIERDHPQSIQGTQP